MYSPEIEPDDIIQIRTIRHEQFQRRQATRP